MTWEAPLSTDQMAAVLDNAPISIYVSALDSYELLYTCLLYTSTSYGIGWKAFLPFREEMYKRRCCCRWRPISAKWCSN